MEAKRENAVGHRLCSVLLLLLFHWLPPHKKCVEIYGLNISHSEDIAVHGVKNEKGAAHFSNAFDAAKQSTVVITPIT